jgi:arylformamidase
VPATIRFRRVVDLSHEIGPDTQMFPAYPQPAFTQWTTREVHGFLAEALFMVSHTGTHVDAPWHYRPEGKRVHELPVGRFVATGHVLDFRGLRGKGRITPAMLRSARSRLDLPVRAGDAVLLRTGWERRRGSKAYLFENPGLSGPGASELVRWGAGLVGIDTANLDHPEAADYPAHHAILKVGIPIIENVANLSAIGSAPFHLVALPLRLKGATGSPVRAVALVE